MKVLIFAGGLGTRLSEETGLRPKPMVELGGKPILWHIMKIYGQQGFNEFIILLGYKGHIIKEYFANYFLYQSDVTFDLSTGAMSVHSNHSEPWKVTLLDTGEHTQTGGRVLRARHHVEGQDFLLTYGDGVCNVDMHALYAYHKKQGRAVTLTAVQPEGRYGTVDIAGDGNVTSFLEKPKGDGAWINGGFFVCGPEVFDYLEGDDTMFESDPLMGLTRDGKLSAYKHNGFWKCMDTIRDKNQLNHMWDSGQAKWKIWS